MSEIRHVGKPYVMETFTATCDENGELPPQSEWIKHEREVVLVETSELAQLHSQLSLAKEALRWIADKKSDTSGAHSMRAEKTARETLKKLEST